MATGTVYTYSDSWTTSARKISEYINNISPIEIKLLYRLGMNNENSLGGPGGRYWKWDIPGHKIEWMEDTSLAQTDQLAEALDDSETGINVDDGTKFSKGDYIKVDDELMYVSSITSNTLTVVRGALGTTAAAHDDDSAVTIVTEARLEGAENDDNPTEFPTIAYNYSQIFHASVSVTGSEMAAGDRYGISPMGNMEYHLNKWLGGATNAPNAEAGELMRRLQNTFWYGYRQIRTSTVPGVMGGGSYFISTNNTSAASAKLSYGLMATELEEIWGYGGKPDVIITSYKQKRVINELFAGSIMRERNDRVGGALIDSLEFEGFMLDVIVDRNCPDDELFFIDSSKCGWLTLRPWEVQELAKTGDSEDKQIVGEFSFYLANEKAHGRLHTLATS